MMLLNLANYMYILIVKPYPSKIDMILDYINEGLVGVCTYIVVAMIWQSNDPALKEKIGVVFTIII